MSNLNSNRINLIFEEADLTAMKTSANATIAKIPADATLTDTERAQGTDVNVANKIFIEDTLNELNSNGAAIMPAWFDISNLDNDLTFFEQADELITIHTNIVRRLSDAQRLAGREAYTAASKAYHLYKEAADAGIPGAQESYNKLKTRFERMGSNKAPADQPQ